MLKRSILVTVFFLGACSAQTTSPSPPTAVYSVSIANPQAAATFGPNGANPLVLYDETFAQPFSNMAQLSAVVSPAPASSPTFTFSASDSDVSLTTTQTNVSPTVTAPPGAIYIYGVPSSHGKSVVSVNVGSPVSASASLTVYSYPVAPVSCSFRDYPALVVNADGTAGATQKGNPSTADFYVTEPQTSVAQGFDECANGFVDATTSATRYNFPGGGTVLSGGLAAFVNVTAAQWTNAGTNTPPPTSNGTIYLFKARNGLIVKAIVDGPYEVANPVTNAFEY